MANITDAINEFKTAPNGESVRSAFVEVMTRVNDDNIKIGSDYIQVIDAAGHVGSAVSAASASATLAASKATEASNAASVASGHATTATTKAGEAATSASTAEASSNIASNKAGEATTAATNAINAKNISVTKAGEAATSATTATNAANTISAQITTASNNAEASALAAAASATSASNSATTATTKAGEIETAHTTVITKLADTIAARDIAVTKAGIATTKAAEALASKTAAATSETNSKASELAAEASETAAAGSAATATTKANESAASAAAALASEQAAALRKAEAQAIKDAAVLALAETTDEAEVIEARKGKVSLGEKINEIDSQLADIQIKNNYVTLEQFGAVGDGVTDDTNALINAVTSGHDVLLIGTYLIEGQVVMSGLDKVNIKGMSNSKILVHSSLTMKEVFRISGCTNLTIDGLNFYTVADQIRANERDGTSSNVYAIHLSDSASSGCENVLLQNIYGENFEFLIKVDSAAIQNKNIRIKSIKTVNVSQSIFFQGSDYISITDCDLAGNLDNSKFDHNIYIDLRTSNIVIDRVICRNSIGHCITVSSNIVQLNNLCFYNVYWGAIALEGEDMKVNNLNIFSTNGTAKAAFYIQSTDLLVFYNVVVSGTFETYFNSLGDVDVTIVGGLISGNTTGVLFSIDGKLTGIIKGVTFYKIGKDTANSFVYRAPGKDLDQVVIEGNTFIFDSEWPSGGEIFSIRCNGQYLVSDNLFINYSTTNIPMVVYNVETTGDNIIYMDNKYKGFTSFYYGEYGTFVNNVVV